MSSTDTGMSPINVARTAGVLYLMIIVFGIFAEVGVRAVLFVPGDAAATAAAVTASPGLFRLGFVADLAMVLCDIGLAVLLLELLRPVNRTAALAAMVFRLTQASILAFNLLFYSGAILVLNGAGPADGIDPDQVHWIAHLFLDLHRHGYDLGLIFFAVHCLLVGWLVVRSRYFPKTLGLLLSAAGLSYLVGSLTRFLVPAWTVAIAPIYVIPLVAEVAFCLWLLIKGVKKREWERRMEPCEAGG